MHIADWVTKNENKPAPGENKNECPLKIVHFHFLYSVFLISVNKINKIHSHWKFSPLEKRPIFVTIHLHP